MIYGPRWGLLGEWGNSFTGQSGLLFFLALLALFLVVVWWFGRSLRRASERIAYPEPRLNALDVLEERYARGEVDRDEYLSRRRCLLG